MAVLSGTRIIALGAIAGLAGSLAATRLLSSLLFEVKSNDFGTMSASMVLLVGVALLAADRAASRVDVNAAISAG